MIINITRKRLKCYVHHLYSVRYCQALSLDLAFLFNQEILILCTFSSKWMKTCLTFFEFTYLQMSKANNILYISFVKAFVFYILIVFVIAIHLLLLLFLSLYYFYFLLLLKLFVTNCPKRLYTPTISSPYHSLLT